MLEPWFKNAVVYELDVRTFFDTDGDGCGDFQGVVHKLDYLVGLGVTTLWLNPFYESPDRDGGYDVADFYSVDPALGSLGDFRVFVEAAKTRGLRVIVELVVNHTSDQHPWFQEALTSRDAATRDFYVWVDDPPEDSPEQIVFDEDDDGPWTLHEPTGQYYLHRFYRHEPDLNHANPAVREEVMKIIGFWMALGVDGLRVDAAPYIALKGTWGGEFDDPHDYMRTLRSYVAERDPDGVLMAEADVEVQHVADFLGDGDEMSILLSFLASETMFLAHARQSAEPLRRLLGSLPPAPRLGTYANFLRNHDELDLEMLSEEDRNHVFDTFAPEPEMRIYGRGIRRRPAPMLGGSPERLRMAHSLTFTLPGMPIIRYGDEIGMGDDLSLWQRTAVRTPMQWSSGNNGGFSRANVDDLYHPVITGGPFGCGNVNVADQWPDPGSLLNWTTRLIRVRREARAIGLGKWDLLDVANPAVLGLRFDHDEEVVMTFHNLSDHEQTIQVPAPGEMVGRHPVFADTDYRSALDDGTELTLAPFGYLWLRGRVPETRLPH